MRPSRSNRRKCFSCTLVFFFFNDTATTEIYTLSLHDALPICHWAWSALPSAPRCCPCWRASCRSEEHTSELQSRFDLVCRLLLEKQNKLAMWLRRAMKKTNEVCPTSRTRD